MDQFHKKDSRIPTPLKKNVINYTRFNRDKDPGAEKDKETDTDTHMATDTVKYVEA